MSRGQLGYPAVGRGPGFGCRCILRSAGPGAGCTQHTYQPAAAAGTSSPGNRQVLALAVALALAPELVDMDTTPAVAAGRMWGEDGVTVAVVAVLRRWCRRDKCCIFHREKLTEEDLAGRIPGVWNI